MPDEVSNRQFAASNSTLNYLLGGRSKSWMTSEPNTPKPAATTRPAPSNVTSTPIKRPVGRPPKDRNKDANDAQPQRLGTGEGASSAAWTTRPVKRPVGRPRKYPLLALPADKRPVGRPSTDADEQRPHGTIADVAPSTADLSASAINTLSHHTDAPFAWDTEGDTGDDEPLASAVVRAEQQRERSVPANKSPNTPEPEAQVQNSSVNTYTAPTLHNTFHDDMVLFADTPAATYQAEDVMATYQSQRVTPPPPTPAPPEAQRATTTSLPQTTTQRPVSGRSTASSGASERRRRASSAALAQALKSPDKQRRLDSNVHEYVQSSKCQSCRRDNRECDGQTPCLGCRLLNITCRYGPLHTQTSSETARSPPPRQHESTISIPGSWANLMAVHPTAQQQQRPGTSPPSRVLTDHGIPTSASDQRRRQQQPEVFATSRPHPSVPARPTVVPSSTPEASPTTTQNTLPRHMPAAELHSQTTREPSNPMVTIPSAHTPPAMPPPQLQPAPTQNFFDKTRCMSFIDQLYHPQGPTGPPRLMTMTERARLQTLKEAVAGEDLTFLLIHQMWCLASYDPQRLPSGFYHRDDVNNAFTILDELLRSNRDLTPAVLGFCATFPAPLSEILRLTPAVYQLRHDRIEEFFSRSATSWVGFRQGIFTRGHPPMVHEIMDTLGITSATLQRLVFLALTRVMWLLNESHWLNLADKLFQRNQADWHRFLTRDVKFPLKRQVLEAYHAWFAERYIVLRHVQEGFRAVDFTKVPIPMGSPLLDLVNTPVHLLLGPQGRGSFADERSMSVDSFSGGAAVARQGAPSTPSGSDLVAFPRSLSNAVSGQPVTLQSAMAPQRPTYHTATRLPSTVIGIPNPSAPHAPPNSSTTPTQHAFEPNRGLLPNPTWLAAQQIAPNPDVLALHQAHLRGPLLQLLETPTDTTTKEVFQHVDAFELQPFAFDADSGYAITHSFAIKDELFKRTAKVLYSKTLDQDVRGLYPDSLQYRVRSCQMKALSNDIAVRDRWVVTETSWHPNVYMNFNGHRLQLRRKLHYGKDMPVDITSLVQPGLNNLQVWANVQENDKTPGEYLFAIEIVGVSSAASIRRYCKDDGFLESAESLNQIKRQLGGESAAIDDNDIMMVSSTLTIPLFEPFSNAKICDTPVRGRGCLHRECFDLDTFLATRPVYYRPPKMSQTPRLPTDIEKILSDTPGVKGLDPEQDALYALERPDGPSTVDCWTCPICRGDARPQNLIVDGFLVEVRRELERQGKLDTRAIVVEADGTWRSKPEKSDGERQGPSREKSHSVPR